MYPNESDNPLLRMEHLPPFSAIRPEHVEPALDHLLTEARTAVEGLLGEASSPSWDSLVFPMQVIWHRVDHVWSTVSHLHAVADSEPMRRAYDACLPKLSAFRTELAQDEGLYLAYRHVADERKRLGLNDVQAKIVSDALREFHLNGVDLPPDKRRRFKTIDEALSRLQSSFAQNVLDATEAWRLPVTDPERLAGLPETAIGLARRTAEDHGQEGWMLSLDLPSYLAVMSHAEDRALRETVYAAYATRASDTGPDAGRWDNGPVIEAILGLRHEMAGLLGYANFAEYSLARKMASSPWQVLEFLEDLTRRSRPVAEQELRTLGRFARDRDGVEVLQPWDVAFYGERLREARFAYSQEDLRPYFALPGVLEGLFEVTRRLYGITVVPARAVDAWDPDVSFYEIRDGDGALRGRFYLDPYVRKGKRGGAWMGECVVRMRSAERSVSPVAYLVCNFSPPSEARPTLLTHNEVTTLFHEFGHGLHHLLTRVDYPAAAGTNGVAWDAVELPSQFMENWCWEREALDLFARHHETGEALPEDLFRRMRASRAFHSGMQMVRQLEFALFDFRLHAEYDPQSKNQVLAVAERVRDEVAVIRPPAYNRFPQGFSHIFSGGYAAGYYSYKWAEVLSSDAFSAFEEDGIFSRKTGERFMRTILEQGGSREPTALFEAFRGREPAIDALLRHSGMAA